MNLNDSYNALERLISEYNNKMNYIKSHPDTPLGDILAIKEDIFKRILQIGALYILHD